MAWNGRTQGLNSELVRSQNRSTILRCLFENGSMTRSDLASMVRLTEASVSRIITECLDAELVEVVGMVSKSKAGRRSTLITLSVNRYGVGVAHIGYIWMDFAIVDLHLRVVESLRILRDRSLDPAKTLTLMAKTLMGLHERVPSMRLLAIGVTVHASVDQAKGTVGADNVMQWPRFQLSQVVREATGLPVVIENDTSAMALAEFNRWSLNAGDPLVVVSLGAVFAMGVAYNGDVLRGHQGMAGSLDALGWLEEAEAVKGATSPVMGPTLTDLAVLEACREAGYPLATILEAIDAAKNVPTIQEILRDRAKGIARVLTILGPIFDPRQFVLTGTCLFGDTFELISEAYRDIVPATTKFSPSLVKASFGESETLIGAAYVTLAHVLSTDLVIDKLEGLSVARYDPTAG